MRSSARTPQELRPIKFTRNYSKYAEGSVLSEFGDTVVLCTASVSEDVPKHRAVKNEGWVTAEYGMLPRATHTRSPREVVQGRPTGRTQEIQRLIGRSLRAVVDLKQLGARQIILDCDVLQADGGTRCAAICGASVALHDACCSLLERKLVTTNPLREMVAAVSVGWYQNQALLDLDYAEDSNCDTDLNLVMTASGGLVEVQGTAEGAPLQRNHLDEMLALATLGIRQINQAQLKILQR